MDELISYLKVKKNLFNLLVLAILILGIPVGTRLALQVQTFRSMAGAEAVEFKGANVETRNGKLITTKPTVDIWFNSSLGAPVRAQSSTPRARWGVPVVKAGHCESGREDSRDRWCNSDTQTWWTDDESCGHTDTGETCGDNDSGVATCVTSCPSGYTGTCGGHDFGEGCVCETADQTCTPESQGGDSGDSGTGNGNDLGDFSGTPNHECSYDGQQRDDTCDALDGKAQGHQYCQDPGDGGRRTWGSCSGEICKNTGEAPVDGDCPEGGSQPGGNQGGQYCDGFFRECQDEQGRSGTQHCIGGSLNSAGNCEESQHTSGCFKDPQFTQPGCNVPESNTGGQETSSPENGSSAQGKDGKTYMACVYSEPGVGCKKGACEQNGQACGDNTNCTFQAAESAGWTNRGTPAQCPSNATGTSCKQFPDGSDITANTPNPKTNYRWRADCSRSCDPATNTKENGSPDCPRSTSGYLNPDNSSWCYGFQGGAKCMVLEYTGPGQQCFSCNNSSGKWELASNQFCNDKPDCSKGNSSSLALCKSTTNIIGQTCKDISTPAPSVSPSASTSPSPSRSPSPSPSATQTAGTTHFRFAETQEALTSKTWISYTAHPHIFNSYNFENSNPGPKFIVAQFKGFNSSGQPVTTDPTPPFQIELIGPDPRIASSVCNPDISGNGLTVKLLGSNFGGSPGQVKIDGSNMDIVDWKDQVVTTHLDNFSKGADISHVIRLTRTDGREVENPCRVGVTTVVFGTKWICRETTTRSFDDVEVSVLDKQTNKTSIVKTSIDKNGVPKNVKDFSFKIGNTYELGAKILGVSLRRNATVTIQEGSNNLGDFFLPVGDIFTPDLGDGVINNLDRTRLMQLWGKSTDDKLRDSDFNGDGQTNNHDWSCERKYFGLTDDPRPVAQ